MHVASGSITIQPGWTGTLDVYGLGFQPENVLLLASTHYPTNASDCSHGLETVTGAGGPDFPFTLCQDHWNIASKQLTYDYVDRSIMCAQRAPVAKSLVGKVLAVVPDGWRLYISINSLDTPSRVQWTAYTNA